MPSWPDRVPRPAVVWVLGLALGATPSFALAAGNGGARGDALAPQQMVSGPSLLETGKVSAPKLEGDRPAKGVPLPARLPARPETKVAPGEGAAAAPAPPAPSKVTLPRPVQQQVNEHLHELAVCRVQVARDKHVPPAQVRAGTALLRWTIGLDGNVSGVEVVEKTPVDPAVLECTQQAISKWKFPVPDKGPLPVERQYHFHASK